MRLRVAWCGYVWLSVAPLGQCVPVLSGAALHDAAMTELDTVIVVLHLAIATAAWLLPREPRRPAQ